MKLWVAALLLCFSCYAVQGEEEKEARLLASKNILNQYMVEDKDLTVEYKIYNVGGSAAINVQLKDSSFPSSDFTLLHGNLEVSWERIAPGSNVTHVVILKPLHSGYFNFTSAEIMYQTRDDSKEVQIGYTTAMGEGAVVNKKDFDRRFSPHVLDWLVFAVMTVPCLAIPYLLWYSSKSRYSPSKPKKS